MVAVLSVATAAALQVGPFGSDSGHYPDTAGAAAEVQPSQPVDSSDLQAGPAGTGGGGDGDTGSGQPFIGIEVANVSEAEAGERGVAGGVVVIEVLPDGPAAGVLDAGDLIVAFNEAAVTDAHHLLAMVRQQEPGDVVSLTLLGREIPVEVTLGEMSDAPLWPGPLGRRQQGFQGPALQGLLDGFLDTFVRSELVTQDEGGLRTVAALAGTVAAFDTTTRTVTFAPKDGSGEIVLILPQGEDEPVTLISGGRRVDLGDLNTQDPSIAVTVRGDGDEAASLKLLVQLGDTPPIGAMLGPLLSLVQPESWWQPQPPHAIPDLETEELKERLQDMMGSDSESSERLRNLVRCLPRRNGPLPFFGTDDSAGALPFTPDDLGLYCDARQSDDDPGRFSMRCTLER